MGSKDIKIVVSGDVCINLLLWRTFKQLDKELSLKSYPSVHSTFKGGSALLLSKLVSQSTEIPVLSPQIKEKEMKLNSDALLSTVELEFFPIYPEKKNNNKVYRIKKFLGFTVPATGNAKVLPVVNDDENAELVIIDDENNGFNLNKEFWPLALKSKEKSPIIIYKVNNPDCTNLLWKHIAEFHMENAIVVINGDDLRSKGVNISKGLSWERTALDFVWQMNNNPKLAFLANCHHLIIPFGLEGAIYYQKGEDIESQLYFLTYEFEDGFIKESQGKMYGLTSVFVAGLARSIICQINNNEDISLAIDDGIREGLVATQKYFINGFGENILKNIFPDKSIFIENEDDFIYRTHTGCTYKKFQ